MSRNAIMLFKARKMYKSMYMEQQV